MSATAVATLIPESSESTTAIQRYERGYGMAAKTMRFGDAIKYVGFFFAAAVYTCGLVVYQADPVERSGLPLLTILFVVSAALIALGFYLLGTRLCAQGQLLEATLDSAVHSSPFLSNAQRAKVMSLRKGTLTVIEPL